MPRVGIIDLGGGGGPSALRAFSRLKVECGLCDSAESVAASTHFYLCGTDSFALSARVVRDRGLVAPLLAAAATGRPLLGAGAGMHLLLESCDDGGLHTGLGLLPGRAAAMKIDASSPGSRQYRVPHVGWSKTIWSRSHPLLEGLRSGETFYFDHAARAEAIPPEALLATTPHGVELPAVIGVGRVFGVQFLPEKSLEPGDRLLSNFASQ